MAEGESKGSDASKGSDKEAVAKLGEATTKLRAELAKVIVGQEAVIEELLIAVFASSAVGLRWFKGTATGAMDNATFENFFLPVLTIALSYVLVNLLTDLAYRAVDPRIRLGDER